MDRAHRHYPRPLLKAAWAIADSGHIASEDDWQAALTVVSEATDEELEAHFNCHP